MTLFPFVGFLTFAQRSANAFWS